jgi:iron complex transport system substrate-binding protein
VIAFESTLETPEQIADMIQVLGQATGSDARAEALAADFVARVDAVTEVVADVPDDERPLVLVLNSHGGGVQMTVGTGTITDGILQLAGARSAAAEMGVSSMTPTDTEQIIALDPDKILLIDFSGEGRAVFAPTLEAPGMETIRAMQDDANILLLPARYTLLSSNNAVEGIEIIAAWLYPELFDTGE